MSVVRSIVMAEYGVSGTGADNVYYTKSDGTLTTTEGDGDGYELKNCCAISFGLLLYNVTSVAIQASMTIPGDNKARTNLVNGWVDITKSFTDENTNLASNLATAFTAAAADARFKLMKNGLITGRIRLVIDTSDATNKVQIVARVAS